MWLAVLILHILRPFGGLQSLSTSLVHTAFHQPTCVLHGGPLQLDPKAPAGTRFRWLPVVSAPFSRSLPISFMLKRKIGQGACLHLSLLTPFQQERAPPEQGRPGETQHSES